MLLTAKLMFDWLGEKDMATRLDDAVATVIRENKVGTYDVGLSNTNPIVNAERVPIADAYANNVSVADCDAHAEPIAKCIAINIAVSDAVSVHNAATARPGRH